VISVQFVGAIAAYAAVTSITPGPNNTMLIASGVNFGLRRSLPHMCGITVGFALMLVAVGSGVGGLFISFPSVFRAVQIVGALYMLYLAYCIARSGAPDSGKVTAGKPFSFLQAAAFQWVNPKAWILALGVTTTYVPQLGYFQHLAVASLIFSVVNFPCIGVWAGAGELLREVLKNRVVLKLFNYSMAFLLVVSLYPMLTSSLPGVQP
jgi:threonine/homoserine/homoserine lactone efflux protein